MKNLKKILLFILVLPFFESSAQKGTVLFFVSQDSTYYSEYIVAYESLIAAGYAVDVRSASGNAASFYMIPHGTTINATANSLSNSSYADFTQQFFDLYGKTWSSALNPIQASIAVNGSILSISDMSNYVALVLAGGTGVKYYRVDGVYDAHGGLTANEVQQVAEKLNTLAINAMQNEKPVLAQCHCASIPVYWRIPNTAGTGNVALGISLLKGQKSAGFPSAETNSVYNTLGVEYLSANKVIISSPHSSLNSTNGNYKIITSADWYPQTVLFATQTLINVIETYPSKSDRDKNTSVLIIHGGAIDVNNCSAGNKANDVPCNYGGGVNLPADYTHLRALLEAHTGDGYAMQVSDLNLSGVLPFNSAVQSEVLAYLSNYDAVIFFKHWSTFITDELQYALKNYTDNGGGLVALHHGMYNDISGGQSKNILVNEVLGASSEQNTWSAGLNSFKAVNTNYGHFVSSYLVTQDSVEATPLSWLVSSPIIGSNLSFSVYPQISMYDEVYNNMSFTGSPVFGSGENQITPLFSNTSSPNGQIHTTGFVKLFNYSNNGKVGRVVCLAQGERRESINSAHPYGQVIRNAVIWSGNKSSLITKVNKPKSSLGVLCYPNPVDEVLYVSVSDERSKSEISHYKVHDLNGRLMLAKEVNGLSFLSINTSHLARGAYLLSITAGGKSSVVKFTK